VTASKQRLAMVRPAKQAEAATGLKMAPASEPYRMPGRADGTDDCLTRPVSVPQRVPRFHGGSGSDRNAEHRQVYL